jgi:3',5'-cyclic AMP phosphodiesterase CpdA
MLSLKNFSKAVSGVMIIAILQLFISCNGPHQESFTFVQLCDTQLGMGGYEHDVLSFELAVKQINELNPDFAVICGDLVNHGSDSSFSDFKRIMGGFTIPCYLAAGNHDVGNVPDKASLAYYRKMIGKDYYTFNNKGASFVVVNTQLWKVDVELESEQHDNWFQHVMDSLGRSDGNLFVLGHYPLFIKSPNETEAYFNIPWGKRVEILSMLKQHNAKAYLSGHKHELLVNNYEGIQLVSGESTSRNFDKRPLGFRLWDVAEDTISHRFVPLELSAQLNELSD